MHKYIRSVFPADKTVSFGIVEPLYRTFQAFHLRPLGHGSSNPCLPISCHFPATRKGCQESGTIKMLFRLFSVGNFVIEPEHAGNGLAIVNAPGHYHADGGAEREEFDFYDLIFFWLGGART